MILFAAKLIKEIGKHWLESPWHDIFPHVFGQFPENSRQRNSPNVFFTILKI